MHWVTGGICIGHMHWVRMVGYTLGDRWDMHWAYALGAYGGGDMHWVTGGICIGYVRWGYALDIHGG